jgi:hypothetical protein
MSLILDEDPCIRCRIKCKDRKGGEGCVLIPERHSELFLVNIFKQTPRDQRPKFIAEGRELNEEIGWKGYVITAFERTPDEKGMYHSVFTLKRVHGFDPEKERKISQSRRKADTKPQKETEEY